MDFCIILKTTSEYAEKKLFFCFVCLPSVCAHLRSNIFDIQFVLKKVQDTLCEYRK